jgi:hypothetical protein
MKKPSLKYFIFSRLQNGESLTDSDIFKFRKDENDIYKAIRYKEDFYRYQRDRQFYAGKTIQGLHHYKKKYFALINGAYYKISKQFFNEIVHLYKRDMSRPDLPDVYDYDLI